MVVARPTVDGGVQSRRGKTTMHYRLALCICLVPALAVPALAGPRPTEPIVSGPVLRPPRFSSDTFLVRFGPRMARAELEAVAARENVEVMGEIPHIAYYIMRSPDHRALEMVARFRDLPGVTTACPDRVYKPAYEPNDPLWPDQWGPRRIHTPECWDMQKGDPSVIIAILDTGSDYNHPDLAPHIWHNPGEIPGNGEDDDHNGYVDDTIGWDFAYGDNDPMDDHGHGTYTAGIAGAVGDNGIGVCGVANGCTIMPVKIGLSTGYMYDSMIVPGIIYATDMGARVLSMSFFSDGVTPALEEAIDYAWSKGAVPVVAAGNGYSVYPYYPAGYDNGVAVAASTPDDTRADFSSFGSWVDVTAPGVDILSTANGSSYTTSGGTSAACPHVAGVAGLIFSQYPTASNRYVRWRIEHMSEPLPDPLVGEYVNYGLVNACDAVLAAPGESPFTEPKIRSVSPCQTPPGAIVNIVGRSLKPLIDPPVRPRGGPVCTVYSPFPVVSIGGTRARVLEWCDDRVVAQVPEGLAPGPAPVTVTVGASRSNTQMIEILAPGAPPVWAPTDMASGFGKSPYGETYDLVRKRDGRSAQVTSDGIGYLYTEYLIRNVVPTGDHLTINYTRTYHISYARKYEMIYAYDFDESYPYGSWVLIAQPIIEAGVEKTDTIVLPLGSGQPKCLSDDGEVYLLTLVNNFGDDDFLEVDHMGVEAP
jgi:hypothetical protein